MTRPRRRQPSALMLAVTLGLAMAAPAITLADDEISDLDLLAEWMTGTFSSAFQAAEDPGFFAISLHITPIWTDRSDGRWFYVEQAISEHQDRPYRQRVHRVLEPAPGLFENTIFTLPNPTALVGVRLSENPLSDLEPADLTERDGCAILMRRRGATFEGSTLATLCPSTLRGAAYATSELVVTPEGLVSWDRGFTDDGIQVWGATRGGYVFDRILPEEPEQPEAQIHLDSAPALDGDDTGAGEIEPSSPQAPKPGDSDGEGDTAPARRTETASGSVVR